MSEPAFEFKHVDRLAASTFQHLNRLAVSTLLAALIAGLFAVRASELSQARIEGAPSWSGPSSAVVVVPPPASPAKLALFATSGEPTPAARVAAGPRPAPLLLAHPARIGRTVAVDDTAELARAFQRMGYRLDGADDGGVAVPRVIVSALPPDLPRLDEIDLRKTVFAQLLLPLVLQVNEMLLEQRQRLAALRDKLDGGGNLSAREQKWVDDLAAYYKADPDDLGGLLERVDIVPPSLALAQAALESGWGTSRVAREGNAVFGQYGYDQSAESPTDGGPTQAVYRLRAFGGLIEAVLAYAHNLNTHRAYRAFRAERAAARADGRDLDGYALAGLLTRYSTRGEGYVSDLRRLMRQNDLDAYDNAWLVAGKVTHVVFNEA